MLSNNLSPFRPGVKPAQLNWVAPRNLEVDFDAIRTHPHLSDRAKRLADYLDGCCRSPDKWAAWPKVSTIADALGWTSEHGARKRVERGFRELVEAGFLTRMSLSSLVEWFDSEGKTLGLVWPVRLPRNIRKSLKVCVLRWKIRQELPILPQCDTSVASSFFSGPGVALDATEVSHGSATQLSHSSYNVRSLNVEIEPTLNVAADASPEGEGQAAEATVNPSADLKAASDTVALATAMTVWTFREQAARFIKRMRDRGLDPTFTTRSDGTPGIALRKYTDRVPDVTDGERAELLELRPHVLAELRGDPDPDRDQVEPAEVAKGNPAPKVREPHKVRAIIGQLPRNPDPSIEATACQAIADALGDHKPESLKLFRGLAGDVRRGELAEGCLQDAFEAACGRKAVNRGAVFTQRVKAFLASR